MEFLERLKQLVFEYDLDAEIVAEAETEECAPIDGWKTYRLIGKQAYIITMKKELKCQTK
jgi:hypothetical protein